MKNTKEIKQALIQIAERKGRPHYNLAVVRDVVEAIKNDLDHPLKAEVIAEKVLFVSNDINLRNKAKSLGLNTQDSKSYASSRLVPAAASEAHVQIKNKQKNKRR